MQRIHQTQQSFQEPVLVASPLDEATLVIGVQIGEWVPTPGASSGPLAPRAAVIVSTDAGESWEVRPLPELHFAEVAAAAPAFGDPTIAFGPDGVLHLAGMSTDNYRVNGFAIVSTRSADLGRTWSPPVRITMDGDLDNDRPWLSQLDDTLVLTWQNMAAAGWTTQMAWSTDGGSSWSRQDVGQAAAMCSHASPAVSHLGRIVYACAHYEGADTKLGISLRTLDTASGEAPQLVLVDQVKAWWPRLIAANGSLVLVADTEDAQAVGGTVVASSSSDGLAWSPTLDLASVLNLDDGWDAMRHYATAVDAQGRLHVTVNGAIPGPGAATYADHRVHVVLDLATRAALAEYDLWPDGPYTGTPSVSVGWSDDWGDVLVLPSTTIIVSGHERGIELGRLVN